jgi:hypothetical protein
MTMNRFRHALFACAATLTLIGAAVFTDVADAKPRATRHAAAAASAASAATAVSPKASGKALPSLAVPATMPVTPVVAPAATIAAPTTAPSTTPATAAVINTAPAGGLAAAPALTETTPATEPDFIADGQVTRAWTSAQARGKQASRTQQTLSGPVMSAVEKRYVESFSRPVPERFTSAK